MDLTEKQFTLATSPPTGEPEKRPELGETTSGQSSGGGYYVRTGSAVGGSEVQSLTRTVPTVPWPQTWVISSGSASGELPGYSDPPAGTYDTYRWMARDPVLALAMAVLSAPILASAWQIEADEGVDDELVEFITGIYQPMRVHLLSQMLFALPFGWRGFEQVLDIEDGQLVLKKMKPLRPDITEIQVYKGTGSFAGFKQGQKELSLVKSFLFTYGLEDDNWYGQSIFENVRDEWWRGREIEKSADRTDQKISGIIPIIKYAPGVVKDATGAYVDPYTASLALIRGIAAGKGISMPNLAAAADDGDVRQAAEFAKLSTWDIDFYDAGTTATASTSFDVRLRRSDVLKFRGMRLPERMALEGQFGTKAEAGEHGDVGLLGCEFLLQDIVRTINWHSVDRLLAFRAGEDARGTVRIKPTPLSDPEKAFFRDLYKQFSSNPSIADLVIAATDVDAIMDGAKVPKKDNATVDIDPLDKPLPEPGANGNGLTPKQDKQVSERMAALNEGRDRN